MGTFDEKNGDGKSRTAVPLTMKYIKSFQRSFVLGWIIVFSFEGIQNSVYMNLYGIPWKWTVTNFAELREIKPILYKIQYSAEFQNGTSENTLLPPTLRAGAGELGRLGPPLSCIPANAQAGTWDTGQPLQRTRCHLSPGCISSSPYILVQYSKIW